MSTSKISVVIPYFQSSPEPLRRAIASILAQEGVEIPHILIVDDGSPIPASAIIDAHFPDQGIQVIFQKNAGAASARNTGLDNLPAETNYVAFLDSDDEWTPPHLANAVRMLDMGYDFYFSGHKRIDWAEDKFTLICFPLDQHRCLDEDAGLYEYSGDILLPIMNDHAVSTPTVVYRKDLMKDIRFPSELVLGEDEVFWVRAMRRAKRIGFCSRVEVIAGKGVNISQGGEWGNERSFQLISQNMRYWRQVPTLLPEEKHLEALRIAKITQLRLNLAASVWHRLMRGKSVPLRHVADCTFADPLWILSMLTVLLKRISGKSNS